MTTLVEVGVVLKDDRPGTHRAACPQCQRPKRDDALGVTIEADGSWVAHCFRCGWKATSGRTSAPPAPRLPTPQSAISERLAPRWADFWRDCQPLGNDIGATYLRLRGLRLPPADGDLRFHPKVWHWLEQQHFPALVALLTDAIDRTPRSLHFTYLDRTAKKADIERPRLLLPRHRKAGAVCRLWPDEAVTTGLAVGEGVETCLAGANLYTPVWSCVDAGNLATLPALGGIQTLALFADHDEAGIKAAQACAIRWRRAGREVLIYASEQQGEDLADLSYGDRIDGAA